MKALKILFADDDLKYSMLLKRFLEKEGYEVTYAGNGKIALEQFPLIKPDLVLLDINMPGRGEQGGSPEPGRSRAHQPARHCSLQCGRYRFGSPG
jgi:CheY-like chemotaxis protein